MLAADWVRATGQREPMILSSAKREMSKPLLPFIKVTNTAYQRSSVLLSLFIKGPRRRSEIRSDRHAVPHSTSPRQMLHLIVLGAARPTPLRPPTFRPPTLSRASLRGKTQLDLEALHTALSSNGT